MDDLISEFITETSESLAVLDLELVKLEQNPNDAAILGNIFRLVHTIKGTCGFLGLPRLESVAHAGENVLGKIRDNQIEVRPDTISIILEAIDCIKGLIDYLTEHGEEPQGSDKDLIDRLNAYADGKVAAPAGDAPAEKPVANPGIKPPESEGGLTQDELDALERAFNEAVVTVDGGVAAPDAASYADAGEDESEPVEASSSREMKPVEPVKPSAKPRAAQADISEEAKKSAIKQGLNADAKDKDKDGGAGLANQSIRVNLDVLENLMQMVGELVLARNQLLQIVRNRDDQELKAPLQHLSRITTELQEGVMKTRMQPIGNAWSKFPRLIRDLSIELGKKIELRMEGAETELDRQLLELIKDPLTHMVRNSCDHGLEGPIDRLAAGKSETGTVLLRAFHEGGHIIIEISDDGRGVNIARVKQKAIENGIATEDEISGMSDQQIMQFIFKAGFSTAEKVTSVSGRGVGMDVVRTNIEKIGGTVELNSVPGSGSTFLIKIPLTLAIVSVLIVESRTRRFAIPQISVLELVRTAADSESKIETIAEAAVLRLRDQLLPLISLSDVLQLPEVQKAAEEPTGKRADEKFIVVCKVGETPFGIIVDRIFDTEEIVVKPVSELLKQVSVYSGNTILGDGSVIMILDPNSLSRLVGDVEQTARANKKDDAADKRLNRMNFLLFNAGDGAPKAVPLELVSRLEEIDVSKIEFSGDQPVVQYRGELMRLSTLHCNEIPAEGTCEVVVFTYDGRTVGLVVDRILDIAESTLQVKLASDHEAYLGSMVIQGKTTDVVDVGYLLRGMIGDIRLTDLDIAPPEDCHLVLVEDSMFFRKLTVPYLENFGYKVTDFASPLEAYDAIVGSRRPIDVIVTDIEMPEIDGFQLSERLRQHTELDHIPIIAFTSTINQRFIDKGNSVGINEFILKTDRESLIRAIDKQLRAVTESA